MFFFILWILFILLFKIYYLYIVFYFIHFVCAGVKSNALRDDDVDDDVLLVVALSLSKLFIIISFIIGFNDIIIQLKLSVEPRFKHSVINSSLIVGNDNGVLISWEGK